MSTDGGGDAPAHVVDGLHFQISGMTGSEDVIDGVVHNVLVEDPHVAVRGEILFQALELQAELIGVVANEDRSEIGQAGLRAYGGEFRDLELDAVVPIGVDIREDVDRGEAELADVVLSAVSETRNATFPASASPPGS